MNVLLDHLTAVLVAAVLLGALLVVHLRGQQTAVEASQRYASQRMASELAATLERDIENAQARAASEVAFEYGTGGGSGPTYRLALQQTVGTDGDTLTRRFSFPTLSEPDVLTRSQFSVVTYVTVPTGEAVEADGRLRPVYELRRFDYTRAGGLTRTAVFPGVLDFDVSAVYDDGSATPAGELSETPARFFVELETAPAVALERSGGQSIAQVTSIRHARSVRVAAATARTSDAEIDLTTPGGIPPLPGDPGWGSSSGASGGSGDASFGPAD